MSGGYRCIVLAALGWLILANANQPNQQGNRSQGTSKAEQSAPASRPSPLPSASPSYKFTAYSGYNPDPCYKAEDKDAADLCAQWRAALAAEKAAHEARRATDWAIAGFVLSALAVIGLIVTIIQGRGGLRQAREGNEIARRQDEAGFKPWLIPKIEGQYVQTQESLHSLPSDDTKGRYVNVCPRISITNIVDMPATIVGFSVEVPGLKPVGESARKAYAVLTKGETFYFDEGVRRAAEYGPAAIEATIPSNIAALRMTGASREAFMMNPSPIICTVEYLDPLGTRRLLGFAFKPHSARGASYERWGEEKYNFDEPKK